MLSFSLLESLDRFLQYAGDLCGILNVRVRYARNLSSIQETMKKPHLKQEGRAVGAAAGPDAISQHLGSRVKHLRGERGWSLESLANASGVSRSMLSEIERE